MGLNSVCGRVVRAGVPAKVNTQALRGGSIQLAGPPPPSPHLGQASCSLWGKVHTCTVCRVWFLSGRRRHPMCPPQAGPWHWISIPIFQRRTLGARGSKRCL